jgi:hypothetical protein
MNSQWMLIWNRQGTQPTDPNDNKYDRLYVAMVTDAAGTPRFEYGKFGIPINTSPPPLPDPQANAPTKFGDADSGSYDPLTGVITITVSKSKFRTIDGGATKYNAGSDLAALNVRTYFNRPDYVSDSTAPVRSQRSQNNASDITGDGNYSIVGNQSCAPTAEIASAVSRKTHGVAGDFDIRLVPADAGGGVECRSPGPNGSHKVVVTFAAPVTFTGAVATNGASATVTPGPGSPPASELTINLSNVPNGQVTMVTLNGTSTNGGVTSADVVIPFAALLGDVNGNRAVTATDISKIKSVSGQPADDNNYRNDIAVNGTINATDISIAKAQSGTSLPPEGGASKDTRPGQ